MIMDSSMLSASLSTIPAVTVSVDYAVRITSRGLRIQPSWPFQHWDLKCQPRSSLSREDAEWYYNAVDIGDPVIVQE